jgi:hypothetical protein
MKKLALSVLTIFSLAVLARTAVAQETIPPGGSAGRFFSVGPVFTVGMTTFTGEVAEGYKIKPRIGYTFGAFSEVDISEAIGFNLGIVYEARSRYWYDEADEDRANYTIEMNYLTLNPLFNFRHFLLGFGIRLPMSGSLITEGTAIQKANYDLPKSFGSVEYAMNTAIEVKIGGNIEILETRGGALNFLVLAGYDLTEPFKKIPEPAFNPGQPDASLHIGLNYMFNAVELK